MKIAITTDSVVDLSKELLDKYDIKIVPLNILLGSDEYLDGDISSEKIFKFVEETGTLPKTSAVNEDRFTEFFDSVLKDYDEIVHFDISSEMSTTYNNAVNASKKFDGKVFVVDTRTLSTGMALLAIYARKLAGEGLSAKEIAKECEKKASKVQASFVIERLDFLYKGGRCSSLALLGANILKIRPQIVVKDGKMISGKKYKGKMTNVIKEYCKDVLAEYNHPDKSVIFVTHSPSDRELVDVAIDCVKDLGFENVYETEAGCTVSSHCGKNTVGILYIND